tara:strand:+ start:252 stop:533 length:282 start_codon:yes stop_codon:yes gene_type:complete
MLIIGKKEKLELKLNNVYKDVICSETGQYISPTHIVFENEDGGLVHPMEASARNIKITYETFEILQKLLEHYDELRMLAAKQITNEVRTDCPF